MQKLFSLTPFLALAAYPVSYLLGFSFNPIEFRWTANLARQGRPISEPMPQELQERADEVTRYLNFFVDALILTSIAIWAHKISFGPARFGLQLADWKRHVLVGASAGILLIAAQGLMLRRVPIDPRHAFTYRVRKGSALLWVFILISGAFSEELWIAFCLIVLTTTHSVTISVAMTIVVFAAAHYSYRFWGAVVVAAKGAVSAILFLHFGSIIVTFFYHFVANLGSLYWNRYWRAATR
jgi:membrane protease YdiL (CAAX protease family)